MMLRSLLLILAVVSFPAIGLPGSGGLASFAIVVVGWVVINQLDQLIEIAGQTRDLNLALVKRVQGAKPKEA